MDHQISDNISITINLTKIPQKVDFFKANTQKHELWLFSRLELQSNGFGIDYIPRIFTKKIHYLNFLVILINKVMDDGDGFHQISICPSDV